MLASTKKGNKPDFHKSAPAAKGKELYDTFIGKVRSLYREDRVKDGVFQAMMDVALVNDGPVGVDYRSIDEAVGITLSLLLPLAAFLDYLPHRHHSLTLDMPQVPIEIDTSPPVMSNPTSLSGLDQSGPEENDTLKGHVQKQFILPASLLE